MTNEEKQAYDWALHQNYQSVSAKNAKTLAEFAKKILSVKSGDPLTLEQLREMGGQPYWHIGLQTDSPEPHWKILDPLVARCPEDYGYGKRWLAYAYTPAHIDREALCGEWQGEADGYADGELVYDVWRCGDCGHVEETDDPDLLPRFCPDCGRAMTPDAWAMLEKRLRG